MKNLLLVTASIVAFGAAVPAFAADLAPPPVYTKAPQPAPVVAAIYDWSGYYLGINGGWGSGRNTWDYAGVQPDGSHDASGATVGGQIGHRWQSGQVVFGVEGQGNWADFSGSNLSQVVFMDLTNRTKTDAFGLITGQIGYAVNNVLLYAKGGVAVAGSTYQVKSTLTDQHVNTDNLRWGAAVGAGLEVGLTPNWSVGLEYDHLFMQNGNVSFTDAFAPYRVRQDFDVLTARINYRFAPVALRY
ncbi:outer membrane protein [Bradyrhizobium sp. BWA-3-5]|uniref:outer membrane protein n=1 Tax=Bradyrhizobium sp. BWA-3-5 TaxID=3080013 RepID=UPI00293F61AF|nr:outer membrane beta-barrel protein [Bradyrhizobium sp. BWA-3-5]WOH63844.1 outer membrane beta-barrel protein [Bradyrhizobium sp. BWA-3-5]